MNPQDRNYGKRKRYEKTETGRLIDVPKTKNVGTQVVDAKANKALRQIAAMKKDQEIKFIKIEVNASAHTNTAVITVLTAIAQGNNENARDGNVIKLYSIQLSGRIARGAVTAATCAIRICIFIDWRNQGVLPLIGDIFADDDEFSKNKPRLQATNKMSRYTIVYDQVVFTHSAGVDIAGTGTLFMIQPILKFYKKLYHRVMFGGTTAGFASMRKGAIYAITCALQENTDLEVSFITKFKDP